MGCDIHMNVEIFNHETGKWEPFDDRSPRPDLGEEGWYEKYQAWLDSGPYIYEGRNYALFSILANVRNGYGFAGVDTGEGYVPIAMPKGLPEDVSEEVRGESDDWGVDGHSHSWFTVQELLDYDWDRVSIRRGVVGVDQYKVFLDQGYPESWSGAVSGGNTVNVSNEEMDRVLETGGDNGKTYYTRVAWEEPYRLSAPYFLEKTLPSLQGLGNPEDVRIVFWFDN